MNEKALNKAQSRLRVAQKALAALSACTTYTEFVDTWYVFLVATKAIYTTLEQGAKASPQARQWFGAKNEHRKRDDLLRYITEARNDDEHGIEEVTTHVREGTQFGVKAPGYSSSMMDGRGNTFRNNAVAYYIYGLETGPPPKIRSLDGKPILAQYIPPYAKLAPVRDRSGRLYNPPSFHLGHAIEDVSPIAIANLMVSYLELLLIEAEGFCKP